MESFFEGFADELLKLSALRPLSSRTVSGLRKEIAKAVEKAEMRPGKLPVMDDAGRILLRGPTKETVKELDELKAIKKALKRRERKSSKLKRRREARDLRKGHYW